jgi:hypothetical protein
MPSHLLRLKCGLRRQRTRLLHRLCKLLTAWLDKLLRHLLLHWLRGQAS